MIIEITISDTNYITSYIDKKCCTGFLELKKKRKIAFDQPLPKICTIYKSNLFSQRLGLLLLKLKLRQRLQLVLTQGLTK